ncbi:hypothetical protein D7X00_19425 [Shigella boydii]|nr:hypothetical protein [Shigella boydii]KIZ57642.1 hypothetical protein UH31_21175 [Escherichia coli]EAA3128507.1 hypothetical protein [Shigella boydii]EFV8803545.1 hypothetical protein [Shigella boydii]EFV9644435.1 hypothetical protein [Shigella boydii]
MIIRNAVNISSLRAFLLTIERITIIGLKPGPKRIADSTGEPDKRQRDNKKTPGNTDKLKPSKSSKK